MEKRYFTVSIALTLMLAGGLSRAEAKNPNFVSHQSGTEVGGVIDTNGDGETAGTFTGVANTTLGRCLFQGESESLPALATNVSCPAGTVEIPLLQALDVDTLQATGEQLFLTHTAGAACVDFTTPTFAFTYHTQGTFSGGTGRFVHATGTFDNTGTGSVLVFDPQGHTLLNTTGTVTGTLTGVKDGGD